MERKFLTLSSIGIFLLFSACATQSPEDKFVEEQGLQQMTSEELVAVLGSNTLRWADGSNVYYEGTVIRGLDSRGNSLVGTVSFANDLHCRNWGRVEKCSTVYNDGNGRLLFFVNGKHDTSGGYGLVLAGNPKGL